MRTGTSLSVRSKSAESISQKAIPKIKHISFHALVRWIRGTVSFGMEHGIAGTDQERSIQLFTLLML